MSLILGAGQAVGADKVIFSGGAPLHTHQPTVIIPLLAEAFRRNGVEFEAEFIPSRRSLFLSNSGQMDGELHRIYDFHDVSGHQYPNLIRIESRLMTVSPAIFANKDLEINDISELHGLSIAYQAGRKNISKLLRSQFPERDIHAVTTDDQAFRMLASNHVDIVVSESFLGRIFTSRMARFKHIREVYIVKQTPIYAYINNRHAALALRIAATLEAMKKDGSFQRITDAAELELLRSNSPAL